MLQAELRGGSHQSALRAEQIHGTREEIDATRRRIVGVITRYNRKTVTVIADGGHRWNVSPGLLERIAEGREGVIVTSTFVQGGRRVV